MYVPFGVKTKLPDAFNVTAPPVTLTAAPPAVMAVPFTWVTVSASPRGSVSLERTSIVEGTALVVVNVSLTAVGGASIANASSIASPMPAPAPAFIRTLNVMVVYVPFTRILPAAVPVALLVFDSDPLVVTPTCRVTVPAAVSTWK